MSGPGSNHFPFPYMPQAPSNIDPSVAAALYHQQQSHQQAGLSGPQSGLFPPPPPPASQPTPLSDTSLDSPDPSRGGSVANASGKRPARDNDAARKKTKLEHDGEYNEDGDTDAAAGSSTQKIKQTRGSRACTVCRRLKMKCVGAENGPPCKRCETGGHECVFEESNRGKRSTKKSEALQRSLSKMEKTLDIVLRSLGNPALQAAAEGGSRTPSPDHESPGLARDTANLMSPSPSALHTPETSMLPPIGTRSAGDPHSATPGLSARPPSTNPLAASLTGASSSTGSIGSRVRPPASPKLDSLPDNTLNPLGLLADTSLAHRREKEGQLTDEDHITGLIPAVTQSRSDGEAPADGKKIGLANDRYFKPGPMNILPLRRLYIERQIQPEMLTFVTKEEVVELFKILKANTKLSRSQVCAVSSKFYTARPDLHQRLNKIAKKLAFGVPEQGYKSVEIVQAYLILFLWGIGPVERFEQERTWTILGLAIRVGTDINLHRKIPYAEGDTPEARATNLEIRNRERAWLLCYVLDRSFSAQMGKPHSVKEDYIIRTANKWWQHPHALPLDVGLAAYVDYQRTLSRALDFLYSGTSAPSGLQIDCDFLMVIKTFETQLASWGEEWSFHNRDAIAHGVLDRIVEYRGLIAQFYYHYANVVINSFGLQNALERSPMDIAHFFGRCHSAAVSCARIVKEELAPKGYMRYSPDSHFVLFSYALLTLLKLIRTEFRAFIQNEDSILSLVGEVADLFEDMAVNQWHTPGSTFLRALVSSKAGQTRDGTPAPSGDNNVPTANGDGDASMQEPPESNGTHPPTGGAAPQPPPSAPHSDNSSAGMNPWNNLNAFNNYSGEIGPTQVQDLSTFPPTFASPADPNEYPLFSMDNILGDGFWDSVLMPGYNNSFEGLSGGFVYGAGGSGFITPKRNSPVASGANSPLRGLTHQFTPSQFNTAFKSGTS
ncbi:hypothetical protein FS837_011293 [Tulasnella sp. UAMH 9824]|nr:hypothetical protein FS837_011293 [Tulasnella sp. UAMH 9824]